MQYQSARNISLIGTRIEKSKTDELIDELSPNTRHYLARKGESRPWKL